MKPTIGNYIDGDAPARIDMPRLLETRMLIQANSGAGKSRALRRLLEVTAGMVQQIVIDPEGEFASLREKHDFIICAAKDADAITHPRTAALLARKLLEVEASAVLDISELKAHERHAFVRLFLEALVEAPKSLHHPVLLVLDEAQIFAPEKGQGESEASAAVIDVATRGRKRGLCLVAATLRISMLHKAVAGELKNRLIGGTSLDVDVKRAAFDLGLTPKDALAVLRVLEPGQFFCYGPAFNQVEPRILLTGEVFTTHPKVGQRQWKAPPKPTAAIVALLPKLADLPQEAAQEAKTLDDLKRELAAARRELALAKKELPVVATAPTATKAELHAALATIKGLRQAIGDLMKFVVKINADGFGKDAGVDPDELRTAIDAAVNQAMKSVNAAVAGREKTIQRLQSDAGRLIAACQKLLADDSVEVAVDVSHREPFAVKGATGPRIKNATPVGSRENGSEVAMPAGEAKILAALIQFPEGRTRRQLQVLTGYATRSLSTYLPRLITAGHVEGKGLFRATDAGRAALPDALPLPSGRELQEYWVARLPEGEGRIFRALIDAAGESVTREQLMEITEYAPRSLSTYLPRMVAKGIALTDRAGARAAQALFS